MTYLTKYEIGMQLKAIQNEYNTHDFTDELIETYIEFITFNKAINKPRKRTEKEALIRHVSFEYSRKLVKELSHIIITTNDSKSRYFLHLKKGDRLIPLSNMNFYVSREQTADDIYTTAEMVNEIYRKQYVETFIDFPSGDLLFANLFHNSQATGYAFSLPEDLKHKEKYSINHLYGEQNSMNRLAQDHGLGYVQIGNTSVAVYKVSDNKIVMCSPWENEDYNVLFPDDWEKVGEICCDVWRVEFIDQRNFDLGNTLPIDSVNYKHKPVLKTTVLSGLWKVVNHYSFLDDEECLKKGKIPVWVELCRVL